MFLRIRTKQYIPLQDIVAVFDTASIKGGFNDKKYLHHAKTTVLLSKNKKEAIIHTNISVQTIRKRIRAKEGEQ